MKQKIDNLLKSRSREAKFFSDSFVLLFMAIIVNIFNYVFHWAGARLLSIESFGILQTILNIVNILTIFTVIIRLQLTKVLIQLRKQGDNIESYLTVVVVKKMLLLGCLLLFLFLITRNKINFAFGHLNTDHILIVMIISIFTFCIATLRALMRSKLAFKSLSANSIFQSFTRVLFVTPLMYLGYKLLGALWGLVFVYLITFFFAIWQLRGNFTKMGKPNVKLNFGAFTKESVSTMIGFAGLTSLVSIDLILVQKFLPTQAGFYAALMLFGKVIIFLTTPVSNVLFPTIISENKRDYGGIFKLSLATVTALSGVVLFSFLIFPRLIISLTLSPSYLYIAPYLFNYALFIFFYSLIYLIVNGYVALNKFLPAYLTFVIALAQAIMIIIYHQNIGQIINISLALIVVLFVCLVYFFKSDLLNAKSR